MLHNLYGSTEVAYASIATPADLAAAPGSVGRPPLGTTIRLLDGDGQPVPAGQTGRIFVGNSIQFGGYTGGGSKEQVAGLMATGDLGHFDADGRLFVDGRDDDMIVSGGENVFPGEVEDLLAGHPEIVEAAVIAVEDPDFGHRLRAYVVRTEGSGWTSTRSGSYVRAQLARYKVPRDVVFLDAATAQPGRQGGQARAGWRLSPPRCGRMVGAIPWPQRCRPERCLPAGRGAYPDRTLRRCAGRRPAGRSGRPGRPIAGCSIRSAGSGRARRRVLRRCQRRR